MTSIPAAICRIYHNKFKRHYLKNKWLFLDYLLRFWNVHEIYIIFKTEVSIQTYIFQKLLMLKDVAS